MNGLPRPCGPYTLESILGEGAMAIVYSARHSKLGHQVALKMLRREHLADQRAVDLFSAEVNALARVRHPHVVDVIDMFESEDGERCLVMELLQARTLRQFVHAGEPLLLPDVIHLGVQMARALATAHIAGVVHRDFKPDNVALIERDGFDEQRLVVKVLDFGVAKLLHQTGPDQVVGTLPYLAPEMASGASADLRCDIYAFGVVMYEMLTGGPPIDPRTAEEFYAMHRKGFVVDVRAIRPDVSVGLAGLIETCLSPDPNDRGPSMHWIIRKLEQIRARASTSVDFTWATPQSDKPSRLRIAWNSMWAKVA